MNVLVTGASGFIGSALRDFLTKRGHTITVGFRRPEPAWSSCDAVVHCAGLTVRKSHTDNWHAFFEANVDFTQDVIEWSHSKVKPTLKKFIFLSTGEVLGPAEDGLHSEDAALSPVNAYTASKACAEVVVRAYVRRYGLPAVILRPCDVYGYGMAPNSFMKVAARAMRANEAVTLYGRGLCLRQWLYIDDLCGAIEWALEKAPVGEVYNVPGESRVPNYTVVELMESVLDHKFPLKINYTDSPPQRGPDWQWGIDGTKIRRAGWRPTWGLAAGIRETIKEVPNGGTNG